MDFGRDTSMLILSRSAESALGFRVGNVLGVTARVQTAFISPLRLLHMRVILVVSNPCTCQGSVRTDVQGGASKVRVSTDVSNGYATGVWLSNRATFGTRGPIRPPQARRGIGVPCVPFTAQ